MESGDSSTFPPWVQRPKNFGHPLMDFQRHKRGPRLGVEKMEHESAPIWNAMFGNGGLAKGAIESVPIVKPSSEHGNVFSSPS